MFGEIDFNRQIRPILSQSSSLAMAWMLPRAILDWTLPNLPTRGEVGPPPPSFRGNPRARSSFDLCAWRRPDACQRREVIGRSVSLLRQWIKEGARYAKHWAYEKPVRPKVPSAQARGFVRNPIDSFVLQNLNAAGGNPADHGWARWLRRVG